MKCISSLKEWGPCSGTLSVYSYKNYPSIDGVYKEEKKDMTWPQTQLGQKRDKRWEHFIMKKTYASWLILMDLNSNRITYLLKFEIGRDQLFKAFTDHFSDVSGSQLHLRFLTTDELDNIYNHIRLVCLRPCVLHLFHLLNHLLKIGFIDLPFI